MVILHNQSELAHHEYVFQRVIWKSVTVAGMLRHSSNRNTCMCQSKVVNERHWNAEMTSHFAAAPLVMA
jgi:hypothetical protein